MKKKCNRCSWPRVIVFALWAPIAQGILYCFTALLVTLFLFAHPVVPHGILRTLLGAGMGLGSALFILAAGYRGLEQEFPNEREYPFTLALVLTAGFAVLLWDLFSVSSGSFLKISFGATCCIWALMLYVKRPRSNDIITPPGTMSSW